jgi:hypothetical protein
MVHVEFKCCKPKLFKKARDKALIICPNITLIVQKQLLRNLRIVADTGFV